MYELSPLMPDKLLLNLEVGHIKICNSSKATYNRRPRYVKALLFTL